MRRERGGIQFNVIMRGMVPVFCWLSLPADRARTKVSPLPVMTDPVPFAEAPSTAHWLMCADCGHTEPKGTEGSTCPRESCTGKLWAVRYRVIDLKSNKYLSRDFSHPLTTSESYAGVFDDDDLHTLLEWRYGTTDRTRVATRCTILAFPWEGLPF